MRGGARELRSSDHRVTGNIYTNRKCVRNVERNYIFSTRLSLSDYVREILLMKAVIGQRSHKSALSRGS